MGFSSLTYSQKKGESNRKAGRKRTNERKKEQLISTDRHLNDPRPHKPADDSTHPTNQVTRPTSNSRCNYSLVFNRLIASFLSSLSRDSSFTRPFSISPAFATLTSLPPISFSRANSCSPASCGSTLLTNCFRFGESVGVLLRSLRSYINTLQRTLPWKQDKVVKEQEREVVLRRNPIRNRAMSASSAQKPGTRIILGILQQSDWSLWRCT